MHYYQFNIGDFAKKTQHLTNEEELAYRRLLDLYYDTEKPLLCQNIPLLSRRIRVSEESLQNVLNEFFPDGENKRCDEEIKQFKEFIDKQRINGSKGGRGNKAVGKPNKPNANPTLSQPITNNQQPITNKQETLKSKSKTEPMARASRLPNDWQPSVDDIQFLKDNRNDLSLQEVIASFKDYWQSVPGQKGTKLNWSATWRNWIRNQKKDFKAIQSVEKAKPWFLTWSGIESKASELGLSKQESEPGPVFKDRVFIAAGITTEMINNAIKAMQ